MKNLLIVLFTICLVSCEFEAKSFAELGGVLYTFQLPENTTQTDVDKIEAIFKKRIRSYVRQKPKFDYDREKQQLSVGVPKSLTSKNLDLCRKLLMADGSMLMINGSQSYFKIIPELNKINKSLEENPVEIDGALSEQFLFDVLELIPSQRSMMPFIGTASISDTGLIMKMIKHQRFQDKFFESDGIKNIIWAWKVDKKEMKAYLHAYETSKLIVDESMMKNVKIDNKKSTSGYPVLLINFDETGSKRFQKITKKAAPVKGLVHIFVSQQLVMSPIVHEEITGGSVQVSGNNVEEIIFLKSILEAGRLPVSIELIGEEEK